MAKNIGVYKYCISLEDWRKDIMSNVKDDISEAMEWLRDDIAEKQYQIDIIKTLDPDNLQPVSEKLWHTIAATALRSSDLMNNLVKATFPDAEDIRRNPNGVTFDMYGFNNLEIPTSFVDGIMIDTSWYRKDTETVSFQEYTHEKYIRMEEFLAKENPTVEEKIKFATGEYATNWPHVYYGLHKEMIDNICNKEKLQAAIDNMYHKYEIYKRRNEVFVEYNHKKAYIMSQLLLPELSKFTTTFKKSDSISSYDYPCPMEILRLEGIQEIKLHDGKIMHIF